VQLTLTPSHQRKRLQADVVLLADDDVVANGDAERCRRLDDLPRRRDVGALSGIGDCLIGRSVFAAKRFALVRWDHCLPGHICRPNKCRFGR
jgi:hypothetical protein